MIARAAGADALVLVPSGEGELAAGERVRYLPLRLASRVASAFHRAALVARQHGRRAAGAAARCAGSGRCEYGAYRPTARAVSCAATASQAKASSDDDPRDVADGDEREQVPRRLDPELEPRREGEQEDAAGR